MSGSDPRSYIGQIRRAATDATTYVEGLSYEDFLTDRRTQQAVTMCLLIIGEASARLIDKNPHYAESHPEVPWRQMRGMRNRIAHGYFDLDLALVWETVVTALPELLRSLPASADPP